MNPTAKHLLKTAIFVVILTVPMSIAWEAIFPGRIYHCTDATGLDYLRPGNWIHGEIEMVDDMPSATSRSMSDPDVIMRGWTSRRLWMVWSMMFGASVLLSHLLARSLWFSRSSAI